jgi:parallel beta-helix repeat protein
LKFRKIFHKKTKFFSFALCIVVLVEILGRIIFFNINYDNNTFLSYLYENKNLIRNKIRDYAYTKVISSKNYKDNLISKIKATGIDSYKISLTKNDLIHFASVVKFMENNASRSDGEKLNKYRKIEVEHNGVKYDAKLKLHLGEPRHWKDPKKSYSLKLSGDKYINKSEKIDFVVPEDRGYFPPLICKELSNASGIPHPNVDYCILYINGKYNGVYLLEEEFDNNPKYFEKNKVPNDFSFRPNFKDITELVLWDSKLEFWESSAITIESKYAEQINNRIKKYLDALKRMDYETLSSLVDIEKVAAVTAMKIFWGYSHDYIERNIRLVYSVDSGLIYYQPRAEDGAQKLKLSCAHIPYAEKTQFSFEHGMNYYYGTKYLRMFYPFIKSEYFRDRRNFYLKKFIYESNIENKIIEQSNRCLEIFPLDPFSKYNSQITTHLINHQRNVLKENTKIIKGALSESSIFINVLKLRNKLKVSILPDSLARLKLNNFTISLPNGTYKITGPNKKDPNIVQNEHGYLDLKEIFDDEYLMTDIDVRLLPQKKYFEVFIEGSTNELKQDQISISALNTFSNKQVPNNRIHINIIDNTTDYSQSKSLSAQRFINNHSNVKFTLEDNVISVNQGVYVISQDMIVPEGIILNISKGTEFIMDDNVSIASFSPINFNGTSQNPITVRRKNEHGHFGVIAMILDNPTNIQINHLHLSGGSAAFVNGVFYNGALSVHNGSIQMNSCIIRECQGDDGINFKNSTVQIRNCSFIDNKSDHVDLDFCSALVDSNNFINIDSQNTGDAIDLSGSMVILKNNELTRSGDKAISVGEESKVIISHNTISSSKTGIAVKDSSKALISHNTFISNSTNLSCYMKKGIFEGGSAYLHANTNLPSSSIQLDHLSDYFKLSSFDSDSINTEEDKIKQTINTVFQSINLNF